MRLDETRWDSMRLDETQWDSMRLDETWSNSIRLDKTQRDSLRLNCNLMRLTNFWDLPKVENGDIWSYGRPRQECIGCHFCKFSRLCCGQMAPHCQDIMFCKIVYLPAKWPPSKWLKMPFGQSSVHHFKTNICFIS